MKTRINLYLNEFKPPKELLTLGRMLIVAAVCFFLVLCYGFYQRANLAKEQRTVMQLEEQKDAVQKNLLEVQMAYASRGTDEALKKEVDELNQLYLSKLALYDVIRNLKMSTDVNYASTLMDVARASSNSMSISRVVLNGKRMDIKGKVVFGDEVPVFIDKFKQLDNLSSRSFGFIKIYRDKENVSTANEKANESGLMDFELIGFDPKKKVDKDSNFIEKQHDTSQDRDLGKEIK